MFSFLNQNHWTIDDADYEEEEEEIWLKFKGPTFIYCHFRVT